MAYRSDFQRAAIVSGAAIIDRPRKWHIWVFYNLFLYFGTCFVLMMCVPNSIWDPHLRNFTIILGTLGIWRYSWWFVHVVRAEIYQRKVFPAIRSNAQATWDQGWRPPHVHFMMTTFRERRDTTELVIESICRELRECGVPATLWLGSGDRYDEDIICQYLRQHATDLDLEFVMVRQNVPGKRMAIGLVLRAMSRRRIGRDDIIVFMDGDAILAPGILSRCAPLFADDPELQAVTTDEDVICFGPKWLQTWLTMRFAQRRLAMQSHALSNKVLTLTGRMSVFRANHLTKNQFIRMLEADHLEHWLWGKFRFLSGDDKSTWYYMLLHDAKLLYVPDALVYTVEEVEGSGIERMTQNFRRWSGNMLRNGTRALKLGPRKVGFFIWWCVLDQRIAMWTMLVSPIVALNVSLLVEPSYIFSYIIWIAVSRMALSLFLYRYCDQVYMSFPLILYFNQLLNAAVKVYCIFRLSKQRWTNRGDQSAGFSESFAEVARNWMAFYVTTVWVCALVFGVALYTTVLQMPSWQTILTFISTAANS